MGWRDRGVEIKTPEQIEAMRPPGLLVGRTLDLLREEAAAGVTLAQLDRLAEEHIRDHGGIPSFLGYGEPPFPATICASLNDAVVHGIPGEVELVEGDVLSIDCGAIVEGWHGDAAITLVMGEPPAEVAALLEVTEGALWAGIAAARLGGRVGEISAAVEDHVRATPHPRGGTWGVLQEFTGHGIGTAMHQPPDVPNYRRAGRGPRLERGLALAVEPMVTLGSRHVVLDDDDWTVRSADGSLGAHFEHTFTLTPEGAWVLTAVDGGRARLAELGVPYGGD